MINPVIITALTSESRMWIPSSLTTTISLGRIVFPTMESPATTSLLQLEVSRTKEWDCSDKNLNSWSWPHSVEGSFSELFKYFDEGFRPICMELLLRGVMVDRSEHGINTFWVGKSGSVCKTVLFLLLNLTKVGLVLREVANWVFKWLPVAKELYLGCVEVFIDLVLRG